MMDKKRIEAAVREILAAVGEDPDREGLVETPARVARMYEEIFSGLEDDPKRHVKLFNEEKNEEMVIVRDIPMYSMCEHHLLPFIGRAHIAYIPRDGKVIGLSKLARIVDSFARRPQLQERLTSQIADFLDEQLDPLGVAVVIEAEHLCMTMRGARASGAQTRTSALRGTMRSDARARAEAISLLTKQGDTMERFIFDTSSHTLVCGILNITPDSFSDGGKWDEPQKALEHALEMQALGADIIDVGAQSTRPGSTRLSADEENARLIPVLDLLKGRITVPISVDTFYPECARTALTHGAKIINDVSGEASDEMAKVVSEFGAGWIIMHNPAGADAVPVYENGVSDDVLDFFGRAARVAKSHGIPASSLCFDPGIGFAKSYEDNLRLIRDIGKIKTDGSALMSAASRKRVIGTASGETDAAKRDPGTVALHTASILNGADVIRAHDVFSAVQSARVADALKKIYGEADGG